MAKGRRPRARKPRFYKERKWVRRGEGALRNPFCPTDDSLDHHTWKLTNAAIREREAANARRHAN